MDSLNLIFCGSGEFGLPTLRALIDAGHRIVKVFSQPDRPAGRGRKLTPTPITEFATKRGLEVVRTDDINQEALPPADLMIVIAFGQKISDAVANHARLGSVNLHASRLPKYRGAAPINWAIINGERETGNSIIRLAQRMDAGAVLSMSRVEIGELETAGELHDRLAVDGAALMLKVVDELARGTAVEVAQDESQATKAAKLSRDSAMIDWNKSAEQIARWIRGMYPWPGCRVALMDGEKQVDRVTLVRARAVDGSGRAGEIVEGGAIACGEGAVEIVEIVPEGKRVMSVAAYRNGHKWEAGMKVASL